MKYLILTLFSLAGSASFAQDFDLSHFFSDNTALNNKVDSLFNELSPGERVAQLIMPAVGRYGDPADTINKLVQEKKIGGVLLLNGTTKQFSDWSQKYSLLSKENDGLPLLFSADAEPSLVNRKMVGSRTVPKANVIKTEEELINTATSISEDLNNVGVNYNFAPVVDVAKNSTVGYRGFGSDPKNIIPFSKEFIRVTQEHNIIATAKHFPGHGLVSGDTHKSLQVIDGPLKELNNYPPLIEAGVLSIMIAHIAVKNNDEFNTNGQPSTLSEVIVTDLLRDSLGFEGLIVTDAMNMGGVVYFENCYVRAIDAGCDILLMPKSSRIAHQQLLEKYDNAQDFREKVNQACKRIIRMKICLGLISDETP